jgi:hypothetical protein
MRDKAAELGRAASMYGGRDAAAAVVDRLAVHK